MMSAKPDRLAEETPRHDEVDDGPLLACEHCDTLYREPRLAAREVSTCRRCGQVLMRSAQPGANATFALSITALIVDIFANVYPVIGVQVQGRHGEATLWQAVVAMGHGAYLPIAAFLAFSMIVVPATQIALLCWISGHARLGRVAPGFKPALRALERLRPWSMVEVFLIGALVAIVKLSSLLEVTAEIGIFALLGLTMLITALAGRGTRGMWRQAAEPANDTASASARVRNPVLET